MFELLLLLAAGFFGGVLNAVAGGGTFITFPALVAIGVPPVTANATATVAALPGYLSSVYGFRHDIAKIDRHIIVRMSWLTLLGGAVGSLLLLVSSNEAFSLLVPFLLLLATIVFFWGVKLRSWASRYSGAVAAFGAGTMIPVAIYGGYFNGGLGIVLLALFALWGMTDLHVMNGLKCWLSFALSMISLVIFTVGGKIVWIPALAMSIGTVLGGIAGPPLARRIPLPILRIMIALIGFGTSLVFFYRLFI